MTEPPKAQPPLFARIAGRSPRLLGVMQLGFGFALLALQGAIITVVRRYFAPLFIMGFPAIAMGVWTLVTGRTQALVPGGPQPPLWWKIGFYAMLAAGVAFGIYVSIKMRR